MCQLSAVSCEVADNLKCRQFVHLDIQIIVRGPSRGHELKYYQQYLEHLYQQVLYLYL